MLIWLFNLGMHLGDNMKYEVFFNPEKVYKKMLLDIGVAKKEILLETYIYGNDKVGREFRDALIKKALDGVKVRVLLDAWGCSIRKKFFRKLIDAGGEVRFFRELRYAFRFFTANHERNHRKLLLVDKKISYIGSMNITASCLNWRELALRIEGQITNSFRVSFNRTWKRFNLFSSKKMKKIIFEGFEILQDFPSRKKGITERNYKKLIKRAEKEILIETPYFIPSRGIRVVLKKAIDRGVKVKIVLPRCSDLKFLDIFRNRYLGKLYRAGVKIYYYPRVLHSKLLIIDDSFFLLGSSNLDYRSFRHQYDINILGKDKEMVDSLKRFFRRGLREARAFNYVVWQKRHFVGRIGEFFMSPFRKYF